MRNRVLSLTRNVIPYVKELRIFTDSVVGSILMQQLDYWFERYPDGFYKFLEASDHPKYSEGKSWSEEIGISSTEFRTAFDKIGIRWKSKTEFENADDKFQGQFYASYQDKRANLTFYFRNHDLVDNALDDLLLQLNKAKTPSGNDNQSLPGYKIANTNKVVTATNSTQSTGTKESLSPVNDDSQSTVNDNRVVAGSADHAGTVDDVEASPELSISDSQEIEKPSLEYTEITITDITSDKLPLQPQTDITQNNQPSSSGSDLILFLPTSLPELEQQALKALVAVLDPVTAQSVLDEVCGIKKAGKVQISLVSLTSGLVKKAQEGKFNLAAGIAIKAERDRRMAEEKKKSLVPVKAEKKTKNNMSLSERLAKNGVVLSGTARY